MQENNGDESTKGPKDGKLTAAEQTKKKRAADHDDVRVDCSAEGSSNEEAVDPAETSDEDEAGSKPRSSKDGLLHGKRRNSKRDANHPHVTTSSAARGVKRRRTQAEANNEEKDGNGNGNGNGNGKLQEGDGDQLGSMDDSSEKAARREYNRLCAAKSRAKRKNILLSLQEKVDEATEVNEALQLKNVKLRAQVRVMLQDFLKIPPESNSPEVTQSTSIPPVNAPVPIPQPKAPPAPAPAPSAPPAPAPAPVENTVRPAPETSNQQLLGALLQLASGANTAVRDQLLQLASKQN